MTIIAPAVSSTTPYALRPDQELARDAIISSLAENDRTLLVSACGTGKTVTLHSVIDERDENGRRVNTLIVAFFPSIALVDQTLQSWKRQYAGDWATPVVVCSDKTAGQERQAASDDELAVSDENLAADGAIVTRDPREIANILSGHVASAFGAKPQVVFSTYQSADKVSEAQALTAELRDEPVTFDIAVLDEAHRAKSLGATGRLTLDAEKIIARKRIAATATPRVTHLKARGQQVEAVTDLDMLEDPDFGPRAHEFGLRDAIDQGILVDYDIQIMMMSRDQTAEVLGAKILDPAELDASKADVRMAMGVAALARMKKQLGIQRALVYLSSRQRAREFTAATEALGFIDIDTITGDMPVKDVTDAAGRIVKRGREGILEKLKIDGGAIANVKCLTEGVDIPELDAVLFVDPRNDKVDLVQAVGRAIRLGTLGKLKGYVVLPVLEPPVGTGEDDTWQRQSGFQRVWDVLREMAQNDTAMRTVVERIADGTATITDVDGGIHVDAGPTGGGISVSINAKGQNPSAESADVPNEAPAAAPVEDPVGEAGARVPETAEDARQPDVAGSEQHTLTATPHISTPLDILAMAKVVMRQTALRTVELVNGVDTFNARLADLTAFLNTHGEEPKQRGSRPGEARLAKWVNRQRRVCKGNMLSAESTVELTALLGNLWWDPNERSYRKNVAELTAFLNTYNEEPKARGSRPGEANLAEWVSWQRKNHKDGRLSAERTSELTALLGDMWWDPLERDYRKSLAELTAFLNTYNEEPKQGGSRLTVWLSTQRKSYKDGKLSAERTAELTALLGDMWWDPLERDYRKSLAELTAFLNTYNEEPKARSSRPDEASLAIWVSTQRKNHKDGKLSAERTAELTALLGDMWWDPNERDYRKSLAELTAFLNTYNEEPKQGGSRLTVWLSTQRKSYKDGKLSAERTAELTALLGDMWWDPLERDYRKSLAELTAFLNTYNEEPKQGGSRPGEARLASWVSWQRQAHKAEKLAAEKVAELTALLGDMWWDPNERDYRLNLAKLTTYLSTHGEAPKRDGSRPGENSLATWVLRQRKAHKGGKLSAEKAAELTALLGDMWWDPRGRATR